MSFEYLTRKNTFIKKYEYGENIVGFGEYVLRFASSCPLGCLYCYLRDVNKQKHEPKIYTNFEMLRKELIELCGPVNGKRNLYLNAGENTDSLVFEPQAGIIKFLDEFISEFKPDLMIELRTKTDNIPSLRSMVNKHKFIISFSLSPQSVIDKYEPGTASLEKRLDAMRECQTMGYSVGFRFEPIINSGQLIKEYKKILEISDEKLLFKNPEKIHSIGLSCIRWTKGLMKKIREEGSVDGSELLLDEFVLCPDKKFRYFRVIRTNIYRQLLSLLHDFVKLDNPADKSDKIFLSTEPAYIWQDCGLDF